MVILLLVDLNLVQILRGNPTQVVDVKSAAFVIDIFVKLCLQVGRHKQNKPYEK
jgi:hypothetical protein